MEQEDETSLQTIQYGENVGHGKGLLINKSEPKCPSQAK